MPTRSMLLAATTRRMTTTAPSLRTPAFRMPSSVTVCVAAAACDYKLKRAYRQQIAALPDSNNEAGARRLYLLTELARDRGDVNEQQADVTQMEQRFPQSPWLAEALYTSGNMYLLRKDFPSAAAYYTELIQRFPTVCKGATGPCSDYGPSAHWRGRMARLPAGKVLGRRGSLYEQIAHYPGGKEIPSAIYWRARYLPGSGA